MGTIFTKDILLDQEQFKIASNQLTTLSNEMSNLRRDIDALLNDLSVGFDTPAGRKFITTCKNGLLQPMDDLAIVILHVSQNLDLARSQYESVFTEFKALNNSIKNL